MNVRKVSKPDDPDELVDALLEPLPGHTDAEVVTFLTGRGAEAVEVLTPGFVSARANRAALRAAEALACVQPKATKCIRRPR